MSNPNRTGGTENPRSLTEQLRRELSEDGDEDTTLPQKLTDNERWAEDNLSGAEINYPASVTVAADDLIPAREPTPAGRARMIRAADRALADRRALRGLLPVLLRVVRQQRGMSMSEVAARSELPEAKVRDLEAGIRVVDDRLLPEHVARWIDAVSAPRDQAVNALRKSLQANWRDDVILTAGSSEVPANVDEYIEEVVKTLDALMHKEEK
jgi:Helix-turn-helix domain